MDTKNIIEALEIGKQIADPAVWKNRGLLANKIAMVIALVPGFLKSFGYEVPVMGDDLVIVVSSGTAALLFWLNNKLAQMTSKKIGIDLKEEVK